MSAYARISADLVGVPTIYPSRLGYRAPQGVDHIFIADHRKRFARQDLLPAAWVLLWNGEEGAPADVVFIAPTGWEAMWWICDRSAELNNVQRVAYIDFTGTKSLRADPDRGTEGGR